MSLRDEAIKLLVAFWMAACLIAALLIQGNAIL